MNCVLRFSVTFKHIGNVSWKLTPREISKEKVTGGNLPLFLFLSKFPPIRGDRPYFEAGN